MFQSMWSAKQPVQPGCVQDHTFKTMYMVLNIARKVRNIAKTVRNIAKMVRNIAKMVQNVARVV